MIKRAFDIFCASVGILLLLPLFLIIAPLIKVDSPGPIFYTGERVGRFGRPFRIFKFRTMVQNAEMLGGSCTASKDPRITGVGKFLRRHKLDELPQLLNVLFGHMSMVGPRPDVPYYISKIPSDKKKILELRPGITDWASIWNSCEQDVLDCYEDPDEAYETLILPTKLDLQMKYHADHSLWVDLKILLFTMIKLLSPSWLPVNPSDFGDLKPMHTKSQKKSNFGDAATPSSLLLCMFIFLEKMWTCFEIMRMALTH